ncbi:MAG: ABC transporter substrate-binding protein [Humidesulfovibrio sp.]|nr:ABC transporter substrate-binding protein [Humidesulfovibrio sp.]
MTQLLSFMADIAREGAGPATSFPPPARELDLLLYAPCPVKLVMKDAVDRVSADMAARGLPPLAMHVPMGCTSVEPYDPLRFETDEAALPGVIASIGFGDFWQRGFAERFAETFEAVRPQTVSPLHEQAGMLDPRGIYTIYGCTPYLFVVDLARLDNVPPPRTWAELLEPRYSGRITMCGDGDDMADAVLMSVYKDFGLEGIKRLAESCRGFMHSSTMTKAAGAKSAGGSASGDKDSRAGAIYIMPAFFACSTRQPDSVRVIWPEDGAAASPLYFLAKKSEKQRLAPLLECLTTGFAAIPSAAWFAPLALDAARSPLPPEASLKWVGWDFIRSRDINALRDQLNAEFRTLHRARVAALQANGQTKGPANGQAGACGS